MRLFKRKRKKFEIKDIIDVCLDDWTRVENELMVMKRTEKKLKKMVFKSLDKIYTSSAKVGKQWNVDYIPRKMFKVIIEKSKLELTGDLIDFKTKYNKVVSDIFITADTAAKEIGTKNISLTYIKTCIEQVKLNMYPKK